MQQGFVSGLLSRISRVPDRLLHNGRRRAALAALASAERVPISVLVICNGNIFRSPFAAAVLRRALELRGLGRVRVDSAGFAGPGRPTPADAVAAAARRAIDLSRHASQLSLLKHRTCPDQRPAKFLQPPMLGRRRAENDDSEPGFFESIRQSRKVGHRP